ncbi:MULTISPECIES: hypothetical protein [unclassified Sphingobium]|uniref:hypothetical protein n=1 Tax=unclassified Sphingobium TaxID=2611147 RepID=UPI0035A6DA91
MTDPLWIVRAEAAIALIPPGRRVLDIGCNDMMIERLLPPGHGYVPLDVARRDERTIVVDLNEQDLPATDADFALGMGVLEYFFDIPRFLRGLAAQFDEGLFSYHPLERSPARDRLSLGWVNAMTSYELIALFQSVGFSNVRVTEYKPALHFYRISKT